MSNTQKPEVSEEDVKKAANLWVSFTEMMKWSVIATVALLAIMAFFLTP